MTKFAPGVAVETTTPGVAVDAGLGVGRHVFTLVVEDDAGNRSQPAQATVTITAVIIKPPVGARKRAKQAASKGRSARSE